MIPPVVFQTAKRPLPAATVRQLTRQCPGWQYRFFDDDDVMAFFRAHPLPAFPHVVDRWLAIEGGAHRADLFRYYFLYIHGGVFVDSDAMVYVPMSEIVQGYNFITVNSINPRTLFQGLLGATPRHPVILRALQDVYEMDPSALKRDYFKLTAHLYQFYHACPDTNMHLYTEHLYHGPVATYRGHVARTTDDAGRVLLIHYFHAKTVPDAVDPGLLITTVPGVAVQDGWTWAPFAFLRCGVRVVKLSL